MAKIKLSILMPTLQSRREIRERIISEINRQIEAYSLEGKVEIIILEDNGEKTVGKKRQEALDLAQGEYVCAIDDDDMIAETYLQDVIKAMKTKPDVITFEGIMTTDGQNPIKFIISNDVKVWETRNGVFYRYPHHLSPIKSEIAKKYQYDNIPFGEDTKWANKLQHELITSVHISKNLYFYEFIRHKRKYEKKAQEIIRQTANKQVYHGENELHASRRNPSAKRNTTIVRR